MDLPGPIEAASALAGFVRARLAEVGDIVGGVAGEVLSPPRWTRPEDVTAAAREVALVIVGAAAPFATTSYARARLLRQLYATGLLTATESEQAVELLELAQ